MPRSLVGRSFAILPPRLAAGLKTLAATAGAGSTPDGGPGAAGGLDPGQRRRARGDRGADARGGGLTAFRIDVPCPAS